MASNNVVEMNDLKKLNNLPTVELSQFQFLAPFRCVILG